MSGSNPCVLLSSKKYIGSYIAAMNGVDAIIFTGGIGENAALIRSNILEDMEYAGIIMDKNLNLNRENEYRIAHKDSNVDIMVIPTNEELVIAIDAAKIAIASKQTPWA